MSIIKAYRKQWQTGMYAICLFTCDKRCGRKHDPALAYIDDGLGFRGPCKCGSYGLWRRVMWPVPPLPKESSDEPV